VKARNEVPGRRALSADAAHPGLVSTPTYPLSYCNISTGTLYLTLTMAKQTPPPGDKQIKTLERVFSKAGAGSRTDARTWIAAGRVRINGQVVRNPDHWVDLESDRVTLDGKPLRSANRTYVLLYKPKGYLTTYRDPEGRPTVYDLVPEVGAWISPVGRLDLDTSGLLIMTNDTDFTERLTNPDHQVPKTYQIKASTLVSDQQIERLRQGVELADGVTRPAVVTRLRDSEKYSFLELTITEGRNRQVRRMLEAVESKVLKLVRTAIGPVRIGDLPIGKWRNLIPEEVHALRGRASSKIVADRRHARQKELRPGQSEPRP
jgi:23S rRNA pseudouridine2605 synthase